MKTALKYNVKPKQFCGEAYFYKLSEPMEYEYDYDRNCYKERTRFVCVSYADTFGQETFIFPADENGDVVDWGELRGSQRGYIPADDLMRKLGWEVIDRR